MNPSSSFGPLPDVCGTLIWRGWPRQLNVWSVFVGLLLTFFALLASQMGPRQVWLDRVGLAFQPFQNLHKSSKTKQPNRPCIFVYMLCGWPPPNLSSNGCIVTCTSCSSYTALRGQKDDSGSGTTPTKNSILLLESPCPDVCWSFFLSHQTCSTHTHIKIKSRSCSVAEK